MIKKKTLVGIIKLFTKLLFEFEFKFRINLFNLFKILFSINFGLLEKNEFVVFTVVVVVVISVVDGVTSDSNVYKRPMVSKSIF